MNRERHLLVSYSTQMRLIPSCTFAKPVKLAMSQQSPRFPCLMSPGSTFSIKVGFLKISWTRLTAFGMFAAGFATLEEEMLNFFDPRLFKQWPFSHLKSQSCDGNVSAMGSKRRIWCRRKASDDRGRHPLITYALAACASTYDVPTWVAIPAVNSPALCNDLAHSASALLGSTLVSGGQKLVATLGGG